MSLALLDSVEHFKSEMLYGGTIRATALRRLWRNIEIRSFSGSTSRTAEGGEPSPCPPAHPPPLPAEDGIKHFLLFPERFLIVML